MKQTLPFFFRFALLLVLFVSSSYTQAQGTPQVPLGSAAQYGLLSATSITAQTDTTDIPIQVLGKAGARQAISALVAATTGRFAQGSGTVPQALADLRQAQDYCTALHATPIAQLSGSLAGGVYTITGDADLSNGSLLTIAGDTSTVVIINIMGDLRLQANSQIMLRGVLLQHVFWNVGGSLSVADNAAFAGVALLAGSATLAGNQFGTCAILSGKDITLTRISALVGTNKFYAPLRTASNCSTPNACTFPRPGTELVRDGSFEVEKCCPIGPGGLVASTIPPYPFGSDACFWQAATQGSPDYYNACSNTSPGADVGVPINYFTNNQQVYALAQNSQALTGQAYAGILMYGITFGTVPPYQVYSESAGGEEIAQTLTGVVLQPGRRYYGEFSAYLTQLSRYSVQQISMALTTSSIPTTSSSLAATSTLVVSGDPNLPIPAGSPAGTAVPRGWKRVG